MSDAAKPWVGETAEARHRRDDRLTTRSAISLWLMKHRTDLAGLITLLLLTAAVSWHLVWKLDSWIARVDIITFYLPWYAHLGEALRHFDVPGWNPYLFSGTSFAGDPQSGWSYLPAMISFTLFSPIVAMKIFAIMHLVIGGFATYGLARVLGMSAAPALIAAAAFEFGPFTIHNTTCCTILSQIAPWIPLAMLGTELGLRAQTQAGRGLAWWLTGLAISQMLAGWIGQGAYNGLLIVAAYLVYRTVIDPPGSHPTWRARVTTLILHGAAIFSLGFALGAAGLLIRLDVNSATNLAGGAYDEVTERGTGAWDTLGMLDRILSSDRSTLKFYVGGTTAALALLAPLVARRRHAVPFFALFTVAVLTMTLHTTPLHHLLYLLPRYQSLHEHAAYRIVGVLWIGPAILAGATVAAWRDWARRPRAIFAAALPLLALFLLIGFWNDVDRSINSETIVAVIAVCVTLAVTGLLFHPRLVHRWPVSAQIVAIAPVVLLLFIVWDPTGRRIYDSRASNGPSASLEASMERLAGDTDVGGAGEFLQQQQRTDQPFRFFGYDPVGLRTADRDGLTYHGRRLESEIQDLIVSARPLMLELQDIQGYNPIQLARYVDVIDAINGVKQDYHDANILQSGVRSVLLDLLNTRYVIVPNDLPPGRPRPDLSYLIGTTTEVFHNEHVRVLERTSALPRAWIVHDAIKVSEGESLDLLVNGGIDPGTTALIEREPPSLSEPADPGADGATVTRYTDDSVRLSATTTADGLLVLSEVYDEGWHAYLDGKRVPIFIADHVLRAVALPAGEHTVEFRYEPLALRLGVPLSALALAILPILATIWIVQRWTATRGASV